MSLMLYLKYIAPHSVQSSCAILYLLWFETQLSYYSTVLLMILIISKDKFWSAHNLEINNLFNVTTRETGLIK